MACPKDNIIVAVSTQAVLGPSLKTLDDPSTARRFDPPPIINRLDGTLPTIEASLSSPQDKTPRGQHCVLTDEMMTLAAGPGAGAITHQTTPLRVIGPDQETEVTNRRTSHGDTDQGS
jgi:hypothetical protein